MTRKDLNQVTGKFEFELDEDTNCIEVYDKKDKKIDEPEPKAFQAAQTMRYE